MASFKLYNMKAEEIGKLSLQDNVFNAEFNPSLVHEVIVAQQANARQGTKSTLLRSEVVGGKKKPHRQKKTGRARQGSTVGPHQTGGGVAFAPKPRSFSKKVNKEAKRIATISAISEKARAKNIVFLDTLKVKEAKTKEMQKMLDAFKIEKSVLVVLDINDIAIRRSLRNIPYVKTCLAKLINVYDVVSANKILMTQASAKILEEAYDK